MNPKCKKGTTGSTKSYTQKQIDDSKNPPDWFPDMNRRLPMSTVSALCKLP